MKKLSFIIALFLLISTSYALTYKGKSNYENFPDVIGTKYEDAVLYLKAFGYIGGYPDGTFKPDFEITRAQLVTIALGFSVEANINKYDVDELDTFSDVPKDHWAKKDIELAAKLGIVSGYTDGTFKPNEKVRYSEALTILFNVHGLKEYIQSFGEPWPKNYISYSYDNDITPHMNNIDSYSQDATRGEIALIIANLRDVEWEE